MINASEWAFPTSRVQGCFFHYCQSWPSVQTNGMKKMYGKEEVKELISESMAMALLPEHLIESVFDLLREKFRSEPSLTMHEKSKLECYFNFLKNQWLERLGSARLSVFQSEVRTNNYLESSNASLKKRVNSKGPNFWVFTTHLSDQFKDQEIEADQLHGQQQIRKPRKKELITKDGKLRELENLLELGQIDGMAFIVEARKILKRAEKMKDQEMDENAEEEEEDTEAPQDPGPVYDPLNCNICMERRKNSSFDLCGHTACQECALNIFGNDERCHMCRENIERVRPFYL